MDGMRRSYLVKLHALTGRNVVCYYTNWMTSNGSGGDSSIVLDDIHGLMEVFKDLDASAGLDLLLHSPGGDPTAADSLVRYMRSKFDDVRVVIPVAAMSAATMWSLAGDRLLMGKHSQLGPVDPQMGTRQGNVPAGAILRTFKRAQDDCAADPTHLSGWVPTLQQYFPGLLDMCEDSTNLSKSLVQKYLSEHMFANKSTAQKNRLSKAAADFFGDDTIHIAHGRGIGRDQLEALSLVVEPLEANDDLQDAVLSVHHAYMHTFAANPSVSKIVENQLGRAVVKSQMLVPPPSV
ncbi:S49 family peptidase [soil metagenome]